MIDRSMKSSEANSKIAIRPATLGDVAGVTRCVCAAYLQYIERVGR